jgi:hypothetical protein
MKSSSSKRVFDLATVICLAIFLLFSSAAKAQLRVLSIDYSNRLNVVKSISFYSNSQGYVAYNGYIGFTSDSGHSFKKIDITNINYNGHYDVNTLFGFMVKGVKAF